MYMHVSLAWKAFSSILFYCALFYSILFCLKWGRHYDFGLSMCLYEIRLSVKSQEQVIECRIYMELSLHHVPDKLIF